ncbi:helix-turn-helix transcriptional regulator [Streptomyces sp. S.PB5]|uniref:ATP-binding protein n=1 Tax=Streptomyces sp. S.PB5 TaxID=3020844 RepID=UPI0025B088FF|nr:helix-turn-helix transcriptional regulator [Streptomyces sp. S.PB5]MDN3028572.1 AAA family ATPase [Streptomyces sp. S.PB5]
MLYGRSSELNQLSDLVQRGIAGTGGALLVRGEAGIGKTALLQAVRDTAVAQGCRVLSALGVQSEASVPFAGLHQLLNPVFPDHVGLLTGRQREALYAAFGMAHSPSPEMFSVGLASLELISGFAEESPVVLLIDDAQWIDGPSSEVLAFLARRLEAERAVMLLAVRDGHDTVFQNAGLPELALPALDEDAATKLLTTHAPGLSPLVRQRLLTEAAGNPLALVELPTTLDDGEVPQTVLPWLPTTRRLERSFLVRAATLPGRTRALLLIAAADDQGDLAEILRASTLLEGQDIAVDSLEPAVTAGLVELSGHEIRFRHPLIRSAVYHAATPKRRLAAHAALAATLSAHQERRAWHRAAAASGPDDSVALDLEAAAAKALLRGAPGAAAEALRQAALLSSADTHRGRLLLRSAEINFDLGNADLARRQLAEAQSARLETVERLRLTLWAEALNEESWFTPERVRVFADVADQLADAEKDGAALALRALWPLSIGCWYGNPSAETRAMVVKTARRLQRSDNDPMVLSVAACADPVEEAAWVIAETTRLPADAVSDPVEQHALGASLTAVWAYDLSWPYLCAAVDGLRRQGRIGLLGEALASQAWAAIPLGKHRLARSAADEARRLSRDTGRTRWAYVADLALAALESERGEPDKASSLIQATEAELLSVGAQSILGFAQIARARHAIVNNQHHEAFEQLSRVLDPSDVTYHPFVGYMGMADLIEAAAHLGRDDEAARHLARLDALAERTNAPYLTAMATYARPLVASDDQAEALFQQALESRLLSSWPFHRARLLLAHGRWLRRRRRVAEARRPLRSALESFEALGIAAFGQAARAELRAAGETVDGPAPDALDRLTPQELQIAKMAATGMTNREIGAQLFISHRTVGQHLRRIFPKLGITSRGQLHLADLGDD